MSLSPQDLDALTAIGISPRDAERQLSLLEQPPSPRRLVRPCVIGDGVLRLSAEESASFASRAEDALDDGRVTQFVPASGAASRMFGSLLAALREDPPPPWRTLEARAWKGDETARAVLRLIADLERLPFAQRLADTLRETDGGLQTLLRRGRWRTVLTALLEPSGLGYAALPKGLIPFHVEGGAPRTALAEQLATGAELIGGAGAAPRFHVTVAPGREEAFRAEVEQTARADGVPYRVALSPQDPATGTLALTEDGQLVRDADGSPLLRPGGHGALLGNLARSETPVVLLRNIDNVLPAGTRRSEAVRWRRVLLGLLLTVRDEIAAALEDLTTTPESDAEEGEAGAAARTAAHALLERRFGGAAAPTEGDDPQEEHRRLVARLDRPLRVCGMVPNAGEPGGGPFWVEDEDGTPSAQIVERAQVDTSDREQEAIWSGSTHFNPVDLACAIADRRGRPYDLSRYTDPQAVIVGTKRIGGVPAWVLERPGLWNGAMARWNTLFVEIPREVFAPVKTVFDLLRPEHRGDDAGP